MRYVQALFLLVLIGAFSFTAAGPSLALDYETVGIKEAHQRVHAAQRNVHHAQLVVERAKARLCKARSVESQTRSAVSNYGVGVGRWVWLARDVGFPSSAIPQLMFIIDRESGGSPLAKNPASTASGLLQFLSDWWYGKWNPFNPRVALRHGYLAWLELRFGPWEM